MLLPDPDEPIIEITSPFRAVRDIPFSTSIVPKVLRMSVAVSIAVIGSSSGAQQQAVAERCAACDLAEALGDLGDTGGGAGVEDARGSGVRRE